MPCFRPIGPEFRTKAILKVFLERQFGSVEEMISSPELVEGLGDYMSSPDLIERVKERLSSPNLMESIRETLISSPFAECLDKNGDRNRNVVF